MGEDTTIKGMWDSLVASVYPSLDTNSIQYIEQRRVFYAGAYTMFELINLACDLQDENESFSMLDKLKAELDNFNLEVLTSSKVKTRK